MKRSSRIFVIIVGLYLIVACAAKQVEYDLPSVEAHEEPVWVETPLDTRDTIFIVINLTSVENSDLTQSIQKAQSELNGILSNEIEHVLRNFWVESQTTYSDDQQFELLSMLPVTLERIMNHVRVHDAWDRSGQLTVLCGFDYAEVSEIVMSDMNIKDPSFQIYFKNRMNSLAQQHQ
ncbi:MAG: hypothetical protein K9N35_02160 [Candidatus Marinimicrobia bacterium]|nr:hypothetical protein [Candidatus Neomarinimicrobiota bacterium]